MRKHREGEPELDSYNKVYLLGFPGKNYMCFSKSIWDHNWGWKEVFICMCASLCPSALPSMLCVIS